ncbi:tetratricopeptide repeat protein [Pannus brasiliensis]|uniref:tetratricopeptide repeat protein n=1 Tax=Pannus brasiliensis TaxID=1579216 RepID=UPI002FCDA286
MEAFLCLCQLQWYPEAKILFSLPVEIEAGVSFPLCQQLRVWGRYEEAIQLCEGLLDNLDGETDFLCLSELGYIYRESGQISRALDYCDRLLSLAKKTGNSLWRARGEGYIAILHGIGGDYARAESGLQESLRLAEPLPESPEKFQIMNTAYLNLGNVYGYQQQIDRCLDCFHRHLQWTEDTKNPFYRAIALRNLGEAYRRLDDLDRALEYIERSLELSDRVDDESGSIFSLGNLGSLHAQRGEFEKARQSFERQKEKADEIGDQAGLAHALIGLGEIDSITRQDERAYRYIQQAVTLAREIGERQIEVESLIILAEFEEKTLDINSALEGWRQALSIARQLNNSSLQEKCDRNIRRLATGDGYKPPEK